MRRLALERGLLPWDTRLHTGLLRHLVLRRGVRTGETMLVLVTSQRAAHIVEPLAQALVALHPELTTVVQDVNDRHATVAIGQEQFVLHGPGVIREELCGRTFTLSPHSFFQTNTLQAERLFDSRRRVVRGRRDSASRTRRARSSASRASARPSSTRARTPRATASSARVLSRVTCSRRSPSRRRTRPPVRVRT
ncbi:MAG: hypothetical protein R3F49_04140 [Planctomycetota bacterium]